MPEESQKENKSNNHGGSRWHTFHFSGKVIICSVFLGLGLILIGGLVFAIGEDNEVDPKPENQPGEMPTKAPITTVGPVIMGIGGFIVVAGVIMCLFETEVCRKRSADSNPLISEEPANSGSRDSEASSGTPKSHSHDNNRRKGHKKSSSPRRTKAATKKSHSRREKNPSKSPSPKSHPVPIQSPKNFLTVSEDNFITPPNSLATESMALRTNSRDAENQTSSSLMKSFTSSGPSWTTSTEFQTPATSFKDTSSSLEASAQTDDLLSSTSTINSQKGETCIDIEKGFLTPMVPSEEKIKQMRENIQKSNLLMVVPEVHSSMKEDPVHTTSTGSQNSTATEKSLADQLPDSSIPKTMSQISEVKSQNANLKDQINDINSNSKQTSEASSIKYFDINSENQSINSDIQNNLNTGEKIEIEVDPAFKTANVLNASLPSPLTDHQNTDHLQKSDEKVICQTAFSLETDTKIANKSGDHASGDGKSSDDLDTSNGNEFAENKCQKLAYSSMHDTLITEGVSQSEVNALKKDLHVSNTTEGNQSANAVQLTSEEESLFNRGTDSAFESCNSEKETDIATDSRVGNESAIQYQGNESSNQGFKDDILVQSAETEGHSRTSFS